jgi:hypothetical protein
MLRLIPRLRLVRLGVVAAGLAAHGAGQALAQPPQGPESGVNVSCQLSSCPPKVLTWCYYHEHWRRWPEEPPRVPPEVLSPFVRPDRAVPFAVPPDLRDEDSLAPRRQRPARTEVPGATGPGSQPPQATPQPTPQPTPGPSQAPAEQPQLPGDLPFGLPAETPRPEAEIPPDDSRPADEGFFPPSDTGDSGELPGATPSTGPPTTPPPPEGTQTPSEKSDVQPPGEKAEDVFDLDDFSRVDTRRLRRYRMSTIGQLRPPGAPAAGARQRPASEERSPVRLVTYQAPPGGRRNPLRSQSPTVATNESPSAAPSSWSTEPIDAPSVAEPDVAEEPVKATEEKPSARHPSSRRNPLR